MLSKRLSLCCDQVTGKYVLDVGTDHGKLPCELILSGKCDRAVASDLREKPLLSAEKNIIEHNLKDKIEAVLSDGLDNITETNFSDIIIAGMGGEQIADILKRADNENKINEKVNLILQPMTKPEYLRRFLCENKFEIISEKVTLDKDFFYTVITAKKNKSFFCIDELKINVGFMDFNTPAEKAYCEYIYEKILKIAKGSEKSDENKSNKYYELASALKLKLIGKDNE